jgi:sec-independent protein translocase protein TatA
VNKLAIAMPGMGEILIITAVIVLLFGAKKVPQLARGMGASLFEFKRGIKEGSDALKELEGATKEEPDGPA